MYPHGGNLDYAIAEYGGEFSEWLDLSTGINLYPYPHVNVSDNSFHCLPYESKLNDLKQAAAIYYDIPSDMEILPTAGVQQGIQSVRYLGNPGIAKILSPTYSEYEIVLKSFGWKVVKVQNLGELSNADLVVLVNPNNPDGRVVEKKEILELASYANEIIIDESFADLRPEISMVPCINDKDITVFKSVGKFFGLPGMRLGFVIAKYSKIRALKKFTGPWNISGPALEVGLRALSDQDWVNKTRLRLEEGSKRLTKLLSSSGKLKVIGSTGLFTLVETRDAKNAQVHFADRKIWTRVFDYSDKWIRLGIPGDEKSWSKLEYALAQFT